MELNELDQPVGVPVPDWVGARRPGGQQLTGRTVRLEPLAQAHTDGLHAAFSSAPPGHWTYMPWGPFESSDAYGEWVNASIESHDVDYLAICTTAGKPLGVAGYLNIAPESGSVEVGGITYSAELQGTVEASEAMYLMMAHAFDDLGYRRYEWKCDSLNAPSRAAAERLGFLYEGTFTQHFVVKGRNRDTAWFGLTDDRWQTTIRPAFTTWLAPENFEADGTQRRRLQDLRSS